MIYYSGVSERVRRDFSREVRAALRHLRSNPGLFAEYEGGPNPSRYHRVLVTGFPYLLIYEVVGDELWVLACAHASRRPGYWENR